MDKLTKEQRRKNMISVKSKNSQIELILGKALWAKGIRYRKNDKSVFGKPDFTIKKYKLAIFCDGEFWHGKNWEIKKMTIKAIRSFGLAKLKEILKETKK